jgi:hypothetical protein
MSLRLLTLALSPLPYNIDGLSELRVVQDILSSSHLEFSPETSHAGGYVDDIPAYGVFASFVCSCLGATPSQFMQVITALVGSFAVVILIVLFNSLHLGRRQGVVSSVVLALIGSFVFVTACSWKETLGILLLSLSIISFLSREEPRFRVLLSASLLVLVFTHHHTAVVAGVLVTFAVLITAYNQRTRPEFRAVLRADIVMLAAVWVATAFYYDSVSLPYIDYLSPRTDLYLYLAVALLLLLMGIRASRRLYLVSRYPLGVLVPLVGVSLLLYNFYDPIFPGIPAPSLSIVVPFLSYVLLVLPAWYGSELLLGPRSPSKDLLLAMFLGPLSLILFALLRSNDSMSYLIVFRTFDFLMIPFAVLVGAGFVYLVKGRERLGVLAGISLVVICASTLPVAYQTEELFGVQNHTFEYEYDAVQWFSLHSIDNYTSDQRLGETGWRLFDIDFQRGLPYDLREGIPLDEGSFYVLEESWSTDGAQEFPFGVVVVDDETVSSVLGSSSVVYAGGPAEDQIVCFSA